MVSLIIQKHWRQSIEFINFKPKNLMSAIRLLKNQLQSQSMAERIYAHSKEQEPTEPVHKINEKPKLSLLEKRKLLNEKSKE
jgi:hypothetical protein